LADVSNRSEQYPSDVPSRLAPVRVRTAEAGGVRAERYDYSEGFAPGIAPHAHEELQLCYSASGGGFIRTGRRWQESLPDRVYVFPANQEHTAARDATVEKPATYHVVYIGPHLLRSAETERLQSSGFHSAGADVGPSERLRRTVRTLLQVVWTEPDSSVTEDAAFALLEAMGPHGPLPIHEDRLATRIRDALLANATRCASLAELATATGTTPHRVRAVFKAVYGVPPARYHLLQRLATARRLLIARKPLVSVASATGFVDQAHLTNRMRRYFGHAPGAIVRS
jgi:AraC-like DNA-binding protein